jgi:hypothetical protein
MKTWTHRALTMGVATTAVFLAVSGCAPLTRVQNVQPPDPIDLHHGATLAVAAGVVSGSSDGGGLASAAVGWQFNRRVGLEGSGWWFDRGAGANAFAAALTVHSNLTRSRSWVPFVEAGPAMYRASFDRSRGAIPDFYRDRMTNSSATAIAFRDPAFVVGGGFNVVTFGRLAIRPAVDVFMVARNPRGYRVGSFTLRGVYDFNNHPTAP